MLCHRLVRYFYPRLIVWTSGGLQFQRLGMAMTNFYVPILPSHSIPKLHFPTRGSDPRPCVYGFSTRFGSTVRFSELWTVLALMRRPGENNALSPLPRQNPTLAADKLRQAHWISDCSISIRRLFDRPPTRDDRAPSVQMIPRSKSQSSRAQTPIKIMLVVINRFPWNISTPTNPQGIYSIAMSDRPLQGGGGDISRNSVDCNAFFRFPTARRI